MRIATSRSPIRNAVLGPVIIGFRVAIDTPLYRFHGTTTDRGEWLAVASKIAGVLEIRSRDNMTRAERLAGFGRKRRRS